VRLCVFNALGKYVPRRRLEGEAIREAARARYHSGK
jgi:hypothetical protein